ncbi:hypothetical protein MMC06_003655 [Schaereria dolodes]|nr:hypothetical protein [Schaereria dolodes]
MGFFIAFSIVVVSALALSALSLVVLVYRRRRRHFRTVLPTIECRTPEKTLCESETPSLEASESKKLQGNLNGTPSSKELQKRKTIDYRQTLQATGLLLKHDIDPNRFSQAQLEIFQQQTLSVQLEAIEGYKKSVVGKQHQHKPPNMPNQDSPSTKPGLNIDSEVSKSASIPIVAETSARIPLSIGQQPGPRIEASPRLQSLEPTYANVEEMYDRLRQCSINPNYLSQTQFDLFRQQSQQVQKKSIQLYAQNLA